MKRVFLFLLALLMLCPQGGYAQLYEDYDEYEDIDMSTDVAMFVPAAMGAGIALIKEDYKGLLQLGKSLMAQVVVCYGLKYAIKKERPDGSDNRSFPSNHTGFSFAGATFLQKRYGWEWGVPAYLMSGYVAWGRVYSKQHDFWDVLAGAAIGIGSGFIFTTDYAKEHDIILSPTVTSEGGCGLYFSMKF